MPEVTESAPARVLPNPTPDDRAFWEGCNRHELLVQRCISCGALRFWELPMCPSCNGLESEPVPASGRGTIWSYTTTMHPFTPPWKDQVPYTVVVDMDEGPRMTSMLVAGAAEHAKIGARVEVVFEEIAEGATLPKFRIVD